MKHVALTLSLVAGLTGCGPLEVSVEGLTDEEAELDASLQSLGALVPNGFHTVVRDDIYAWDAILGAASDGPGPIIASQNRPDSVPPSRWARHVSVTWFESGTHLADTIHQIFSAPDAPKRVMIDELRVDSIQLVADAAYRLRTLYPQWRGRWGAYLVNGQAVSYARLNPAIDQLLLAGAPIGAEMYIRQSAYCASGSTAAARDQWLADFFRGTQGKFPQARFKWLVERRAHLGSESHLSVLFGVTDDFLDGKSPGVFLDRLFYVWANLSKFPSTLLIANGGPGAWKWDQPYMSNTSRDLAFVQSLQHYAISGKKTSRLGAVPCP